MTSSQTIKHRPNTKEEIKSYLFRQFPHLIIKEEFNGHVLNMEDNIVYARVYTDNNEEYDCELDKHLFPLKDLKDNISFYLIIGSIKGEEFSHINYFYWTQEQIDSAKIRAEELASFFLNDEDNKKA